MVVDLVVVGSRSKVVSDGVVKLLPVANVTDQLDCIETYCTVN